MAILKFLEDRLALPNIYSPARCLLGDLEEEELTNSQKTLLRLVFLYAKKALSLRWRDPVPPSLQSWVELINKALPMYKLTYTARGCPKKFEKIWAGRIKSVSGDIEVWCGRRCWSENNVVLGMLRIRTHRCKNKFCWVIKVWWETKWSHSYVELF